MRQLIITYLVDKLGGTALANQPNIDPQEIGEAIHEAWARGVEPGSTYASALNLSPVEREAHPYLQQKVV